MSISVDDLVASFSGSHIGQDAIDLATLQAQLAQTLFSQLPIQGQTVNPGRVDIPDNTQPHCNTPTATRTPSSSTFNFGQISDMRCRGSSTSMSRSRSRKNSIVDEAWHDVDEMDEDERMVEDLLIPSSPMSCSITPTNAANFGHPHQQMPSIPRPSIPIPAHVNNNAYSESPPASSLFTTTDPFYIAQLQALQNPIPSNSIFAQAGRPSQHSPFNFQHSRHSSQHKFVHPMGRQS